jgi:hypothetical protein
VLNQCFLGGTKTLLSATNRLETLVCSPLPSLPSMILIGSLPRRAYSVRELEPSPLVVGRSQQPRSSGLRNGLPVRSVTSAVYIARDKTADVILTPRSTKSSPSFRQCPPKRYQLTVTHSDGTQWRLGFGSVAAGRFGSGSLWTYSSFSPGWSSPRGVRTWRVILTDAFAFAGDQVLPKCIVNAPSGSV